MELLKYESSSAPTDSQNGRIKELIKKIRYYRNEVSAEEFKSAIPELKEIERKLQSFDVSIGDDVRDYIDEIMQELDEEDAIDEKIIEEVQRASTIVVRALCQTEFSLDVFAYDLNKQEGVWWLEFYGYKEEKNSNQILILVCEVFRTVCNKYNVIFIDSSVNGK